MGKICHDLAAWTSSSAQTKVFFRYIKHNDQVLTLLQCWNLYPHS